MAEQRNTRRVLRNAPPWSAVGGGTPGGQRQRRHVKQCFACFDDPQTEDDEGNRRRVVEDKGEAQVDILAARGVLRPLPSSTNCAACGLSAVTEAAYKCFSCESWGHVRCMGLCPTQNGQPNRDIRCTRCVRAASGTDFGSFSSAESPCPGDPLIVDVMGVCGGSGRTGVISTI